MNESLHISEESLELFAAGALPQAEASAVGAHTLECAECAAKLAEALGTVALLALAADQHAPAAAVKEKLFAQIAAERVAGGDRMSTTEPKRSGANWWNWVLLPVTAVLALFCAALYHANQNLRHELRQAQRVAASFEQERLHVIGLVNALSAKDTDTIRLASTKDGFPGTGAVVRYNKRLGKVIYTADLPEPPPGKVYQMWLVPASGEAPISAGTFTPNGSRPWDTQVPANSEAKAFAVTVEPEGGVDKATGKIILLGAG